MKPVGAFRIIPVRTLFLFFHCFFRFAKGVEQLVQLIHALRRAFLEQKEQIPCAVTSPQPTGSRTESGRIRFNA